MHDRDAAGKSSCFRRSSYDAIYLFKIFRALDLAKMSTMNSTDRKAYFLWKKDQNIPERVIAEAQQDAAQAEKKRICD